jgi:16S rRNA (cytosine1402-N4)-methyltransferase
MLADCIDSLAINPNGVYVDVTFGGGGHSKVIFDKLDKGKLIAFDQDPDARKNAWDDDRFSFVAGNFSYLQNHLRLMGIEKVDGILADLGVSSHQFDQPERGFSIRSDQPLDMRMNPSDEISAKEVVNNYELEELRAILWKYGEIKNAGRVADAIVKERASNPIITTGQLVVLLKPLAPRKKENQFLAQVFQAIRIEVNREMEVLEKFLEQTTDVLKPNGRLVVMSYHSLEDRLVKNFMKRGSFDGKIEKDFFGNVLKPFTEVTRKPIIANEIELESNPRSRSAKLRVAYRNDTDEG